MSEASAEQPQAAPHPPFPKDAKLSAQLAYLHNVFAGRPMLFRDMVGVLGAHAPLLLIILLALLFTVPNPIPVSAPFGFAIVVVAISLLRGREPRFSEKILNARFSPSVHDKLVRFSARISKGIERWLHPGRAAVILATPARERLHVFGLLLSGVYLLLPLPVPFSNTFPAWAIMFVASGLIGRDGVFVMLGHAVLVAGVFYLVFLGATMAVVMNQLWDWITGLF